ncbi:MAG: hypothetical protein R3F55_07540 [Alphaproteobacteria bacterium]
MDGIAAERLAFPRGIDRNRPLHGLMFLSHGRTACHWLVAALNTHPAFNCSLSLLGLPVFGEARWQTPTRRARILAAYMRRREPMGPDAYFAALRWLRPARFQANVHKFSVSSLLGYQARGKARRRYAVVNLVRHPFARIESLAAKSAKDFVRQGHPDTPRQLSNYHATVGGAPFQARFGDLLAGLDVSLDDPHTMGFLAALHMVTVEVGELAQPFLHVPMERLTADRAYFRALLLAMTDGAVAVDDGFLDHVFAQDAIDRMTTAPAQGPDAIAAGWPAWKRRLWQRLDTTLDASTAYASVGYRLA